MIKAKLQLWENGIPTAVQTTEFKDMEELERYIGSYNKYPWLRLTIHEILEPTQQLLLG